MSRKDYYDKSGLAYYWLEKNMGRVLVIGLFACLAIWSFLLEGQDSLSMGQRLVRSLGSSVAGIVIAAVTVEALAKRRQDEERKEILLGQLGSSSRDVTEMALIGLRNRGWLYDGSLSGANLGAANLSGANLREANMSEASLLDANLSGANLFGSIWLRANLSGVNLSGAELFLTYLNEAHLCGANLSGANLTMADLSGAYWGINLSGANLREANLCGARSWTIRELEQADGLDGSIMPDGVQLGCQKSPLKGRIEGPTFEEWKAMYLAEHGGTIRDLRDIDDLGLTAL